MARGDLSRRWTWIGVIAAAVIVLSVPTYVIRQSRGWGKREAPIPSAATFVGREACIECHEQEYRAWLGSDHDHAMALAGDSTVRGDFNDAVFRYRNIEARFYRRDGKFYVHTQGPHGEPGEFEIAYTFGWEPLQQYLIPFPGGRLQSLTIAWDTEREEWFYLYPEQEIPPDDWLHWTRSAQNWNGMCAECHSTNLVKNFDFVSQTFATTWSEIDVSCEACHGPGSRHVEWAAVPPMARPDLDNYGLETRTSDISARQLVELCAPCHSRRGELGDYDHTQDDLLDYIRPSVLEEGLYYPDGQILEEVYVYGSFVQSKMYRMEVRCSDCHDSHSLKLHEEGNALCTRCHQVEVYDSYDHHFHKREHEGKPSDGHLCVKCHMPERPYMVVDWRADHSLRVPRPDLTLEIGVPNACSQSGCHDDKSDEWSADNYEKWYGQARKPHYGTVLAAGRAGDPDAHEPLIRLAGNELQPTIVRATALQLLSAYPAETTTSAFTRALADTEALLRYTAVSGLRASGQAEMVRLLAPLLLDPVRGVRMLAASRLAGPPSELLKPYQREALEESLAEYIDAMEYSLDFAYAGHNLGNLYSQLGDAGRAGSYYQAAIDIDDLFYPAKENLAVLYSAQGRNDEAERLLREVIEDYPEQYDAWYSLGLLLAELNRFDEAAESLRRATVGMPDRARVFYNLGLVEQRQGRRGRAEAALTRSAELEPQNLDYLYALADHYLKVGQPQKALALAERMIEAHPENPMGRNVKAFVESVLSSGRRN